MLFGIIINVIILSFTDRNYCDSPPCDPYIFYLIISMILGFVVAKVLYKIDPPSLDDDDHRELPPTNYIDRFL